MANSIECEKYGFFNGVMGLEQSNWANFWRGFIPNCVISSKGGTWSEMAGEFQVYTSSGGIGMAVHVKTGQAFVNGHHIWNNSEKTLDIEASGTSQRTDSVVLRISYGNNGLSKAYIAVKTNSTTMTQTTGTTYEYKLAEITVPANSTNILPANIKNTAFIHMAYDDEPMTFSTTTVTPQHECESRCSSALGSLRINLPLNPFPQFCTAVTYSTSASFSGVTVYKGETNITSNTSALKIKGDVLNMTSKRYNLSIWWDGSCYWIASAAA